MGYVGDDNLLQNRETLLIAGKELNKLLMFSHQKHNGLNHKERYKKSPFKMWPTSNIWKQHSQIKTASTKKWKAVEIREMPAI